MKRPNQLLTDLKFLISNVLATVSFVLLVYNALLSVCAKAHHCSWIHRYKLYKYCHSVFITFVTCCTVVPPPNLGDVRLYEPELDRSKTPVRVYGKVQVYFTDGGLSPPAWSYVCYDTFRISEATVLCRQIGYFNGNAYHTTLTNVR